MNGGSAIECSAMRQAALRAFFAHQREAGPAEHRDDLPQSAGVGAMYLFEPRMVGDVEFTGGSQFGAHGLIVRFHVEKSLLE